VIASPMAKRLAREGNVSLEVSYHSVIAPHCVHVSTVT
jgi:hypothetical protein